MILFLTVVGTSLLALLLWNIFHIVLAHAPALSHSVLIGNGVQPSSETVIPKIIWSYWQQEPLPLFIARCHENWQRFAPDHEVRIVSRENLAQWISTPIISNFESLPPYRQADWIRVQLLRQHGGIWMDASIILTHDLNWVQRIQQEQSSEYVGFYLNKFTARMDQPIIENWFMAAIPNSRYIVDLAIEFDRALAISEAQYLIELEQQGKRERIAQKLNASTQRYLIMHMTASVLLDRNSMYYRLALTRAEDSALAFHHSLSWRKRQLYAKLALMSCPKSLPALIKLRGNDRRIFNKFLAKNWLNPKSFLAKYLML